MPPTLDEILELDLLTLREHTERAGGVLDRDRHREALSLSMEVSRICFVRRADKLVAYSMLRRESATCWFVTGLATHPSHRTAGVMRELLVRFAELVKREGIEALRSNVYKTNLPSMSLHIKLGFRITRENEHGVEFFAPVGVAERARGRAAVAVRGR